ncbi:MAG: hypothetical protein ACLSHC_04385 [Bilophila wadsworthia]
MFEAGIQLKQSTATTPYAISTSGPGSRSPPAVGRRWPIRQARGRTVQPRLHAEQRFGWARRRHHQEQGAELTTNDVILTCGAAGALNVIFRTVLEPGDEVLP